MDLIQLLVVVFVLAIVAYVFFKFVPVSQTVRTIIFAFAALIFCVWLLQWAGLTHISLPRGRG